MSNNVRTALSIIFIIAIAYVPATSQDSPWPMSRHDPLHTGLSPYSGPNDSTLNWSFSANDGIVSSPIIGYDGTIYVGAGWYFWGTLDSCLYALNPDGSIKWCFKGEDGFFSTPVLGPDGTLYVSSVDGYLYAIEDSVTYGKQRWRTYLEYWFSLSSPALAPDGGTVYVGSPSFYFYAIDTVDGSIKWQYKTNWCIISSPAVLDDGTIYIGSKDHKLYAFDDALEGPLWSFPAGTFYDGHLVDASPAVGSDGTIYVGTDQYGAAGQTPIPVDTSFWAVNPDGSLKWAFATGDGVESSPAIGPDGTIYFGSYDSCLYAVTDIGTEGVLKWKFKSRGSIDASPTVDANGIIYIGSRDSTLYALYPEDGSIKWTFTAGDGFESSATIDGRGYLYVGNFDGNLYCIGTGAPDVGVVSIDLPSQVQTGEIYTPSAILRNFRSVAQDFDLSCEIDSASINIYTDTISINDFPGGEISARSLKSWLVGNTDDIVYTIRVTAILPEDETGTNNVMEKTVLSSTGQYLCGDANGDGSVNVGDAVFLINYVFSGGPAPAPIAAGDANNDGSVNVGDAVYIINYVFSGGPPPCE